MVRRTAQLYVSLKDDETFTQGQRSAEAKHSKRCSMAYQTWSEKMLKQVYNWAMMIMMTFIEVKDQRRSHNEQYYLSKQRMSKNAK